MTTRVNERDRRDAGMALLVAVVLLALMGIMGLSSLDTVTRDRQVAGFQSRSQTALYAAEGGVAFAMALLRQDAQALAEGGEGALYVYNPSSGTPSAYPEPGAPEVLGSGTFPAGQPRFFRDPAARDPNNLTAPGQAIRYIGRGNPCAGWVMSQNTGVQWAEALWDLRVRGDNPGGTRVNIQALGANCHPYNANN